MNECVSKVGQDYARLRELAEKATPGPWSWTDGNLRASCLDSSGIDEFVLSIDYDHRASWASIESTETDAAFIAAANPATVLQLLADNERMKEALSNIEALTDTPDNKRGLMSVSEFAVAGANTIARAALNPIQTTGDHHAR